MEIKPIRSAADHHQIYPRDPIEAIIYHLESRGLARSAVEPCIGSLRDPATSKAKP